MSLNCEIVMDLISLYHDGLASASTKKAVSEHLKECAACRESYGEYKKIYRMHRLPEYENHARKDFVAQDYKALADKMRQKRILILLGFCSYVCISLCLLAMVFLKGKRDF